MESMVYVNDWFMSYLSDRKQFVYGYNYNSD